MLRLVGSVCSCLPCMRLGRVEHRAKELVQFSLGEGLHWLRAVLGWAFCSVLLRKPRRRSGALEKDRISNSGFARPFIKLWDLRVFFPGLGGRFQSCCGTLGAVLELLGCDMSYMSYMGPSRLCYRHTTGTYAAVCRAAGC